MEKPEVEFETPSLKVENLSYNEVDDIKEALNEKHMIARIGFNLLRFQDLRESPDWEDRRKREELADKLAKKLAEGNEESEEYEGITLIAPISPTPDEVAEIKDALYEQIGVGLEPLKNEVYAKLRDLPIRIITEDDAKEVGYF